MESPISPLTVYGADLPAPQLDIAQLRRLAEEKRTAKEDATKQEAREIAARARSAEIERARHEISTLDRRLQEFVNAETPGKEFVAWLTYQERQDYEGIDWRPSAKDLGVGAEMVFDHCKPYNPKIGMAQREIDYESGASVACYAVIIEI